jgi:hypothetical protein
LNNQNLPLTNYFKYSFNNPRADPIEEQIRNLEKQRRELLYQKRTEEREERNRRLQKRGKYIENFIDGASEMTDEQFYSIVASVFNKHTNSEAVGWGVADEWDVAEKTRTL